MSARHRRKCRDEKNHRALLDWHERAYKTLVAIFLIRSLRNTVIPAKEKAA